MKKDFLRTTLAEESRAYGFTIAFWGSGAMLIRAYQVPTLLEALSYGIGAVTGFALLTLYAYRDFSKPVITEGNRYPALGIVHYLAALVPALAAYYLTSLPPLQAFALTGFFVSVFYNLGMVVEEFLAEKLKRKENA